MNDVKLKSKVLYQSLFVIDAESVIEFIRHRLKHRMHLTSRSNRIHPVSVVLGVPRPLHP
jgi:hypothetical protein